MAGRPLAVAVLLALAPALAGCGDGGPAEAEGGDLPAEGSLLGVVVDQAIRPLAGADVAVRLADGAPRNATTGEDGTFAFAGLAPGSYVVEARKPRYLSAQAIAAVVAGQDEPPLVSLRLNLEEADLPFAVALEWEGLIGCATVALNLCSVPSQGAGADPIGDQSAHFFWEELAAQGRSPDAVQVEAVWEATLPTSERMKPYVGWTTPEDWTVFVYGGVFDTSTQASPSFYRVSAEQAAEVGLGTETGLIVEFIGAGEPTDPAADPPGLVVNQPVSLFVHLFYGYVPPDGWRFVTDGPPPAPPPA